MTYLGRFNVILIFLIVVLQIFSPVFYVPGGDQYGASVFRVVLFSIGLFIYIKNGTRNFSFYENIFLLSNILLIIWLAISLFWSINFSSGVKHVAYFSTTLMLAYVFSYFSKFHGGSAKISQSVSIVGIFVLLISFYEIYSGDHFFRSSLQDISEFDRSLSYVTENQAWFTFGNPNDLAVHVAVCCIATLIFSKSKIYSSIYLLLSIYLVNLLDSRIVVVAITLLGILLVLFSFLNYSESILKISILFIISGGVLLLMILSQIDRIEFLDVSSFVRLQLIVSAIDMAQHTYLMGIGAGGFEAEMWYGGYLGRTIGITNPHNGFGRLLAENGVLGLVLFLYMLLLPLFAIRRAPQAGRLAAAIASSVIVIPLLLSVGSDPMSSSSLQLAIALTLVGARSAFDKVQPHKPEHGPLQPREFQRIKM